MCFKWAVTRALFPVERDSERVTKLLKKQAETLNWSDISFPPVVSEELFATFERNNNVGVCLYACGEGSTVYRLRSPPKLFGKVITLFLHKLVSEGEVSYHFCVVKRLSALLRGNRSKLGRKSLTCSYCAKTFCDVDRAVKQPDGRVKKEVVFKAESLHKEHESNCQYVGSVNFVPEEIVP